MIAKCRRVALPIVIALSTSTTRAEDAGLPAYGDSTHLRLDYGIGGSNLGLRGELGIGVVAWSALYAGLQLGGATELFGGNVTDVTGLLGAGIDLGTATRVELLAELGHRDVRIDESGLLGSGPRYGYASPHAGARVGIDWRLGSRNDWVHGRFGVAVFVRGDLDGASSYEDTYQDCGWDLFGTGQTCTTETFDHRSGGGIEGGVMLRISLDLPM